MHRIARRLAVLGLLPLGVAGLTLPAAHAEGGAATGATGLAAVSAATPGAGSAARTSTSPRDRGYHTWRGASTSVQQRQVRQYWNRSRLRSAEPMENILFRNRRAATRPGQDVTRPGRPGSPGTGSGSAGSGSAGSGSAGAGSGGSSGSSGAATGTPTVVPPTTGQNSLGNSVRQVAAAIWPGTGAIATTAGRVFFTIQEGGRTRTASCSGTAVNSANRSVVITAGHCVKSNGQTHRNVVFVPGFQNGNRPFGTWVATNLFTTQQWNANEDINFDIAAFVVAPLNGRNLVDVVGGQGVAFNQQRGLQMYSFGYPAAAPFDGSRLIFCAGRTINDPLQTNDLGLRCDMTGGSSGGPWLLAFNERTGTGLVNSVNSFKYNVDPRFMFGPFFGPEAQAVYNAAQSLGAQ